MPKNFDLKYFPYINEKTSKLIQGFFGNTKEDYKGKKAHVLYNRYMESANDQGINLSESDQQELINSLRIVIDYANSIDRKSEVILEMMETPGVSRRGAEILCDLGKCKDDFSYLVKGQIPTHKFVNGEMVQVKIEDILEEQIIVDLPTEATRLYDEVLRTVDIGRGEAEELWNVILALMVAKNIHAGPGPTLIRPP